MNIHNNISPLSENFYKSTRKKLLNLIHEKNLDGCLVTNPANIFYFTGFFYVTNERPSGFYLSKNNKTKLFIPLLEKENSESLNVDEINIYEEFIEGAKEGFNVSIRIIPYLIAMLCAIGAFTTSGAMEFIINGMGSFFGLFLENTQFVEALPTAIMKPLSGSGARGMMVESWGQNASQINSFVGKLTSTLQGSTETTFYVLAVYFGSVGIRNTRYAVVAGLFADFIGIISAIAIAYVFWG